MKVKFIDYHGRRAGVFATISNRLLDSKFEHPQGIFSSGGLPQKHGTYVAESDLIVGRKYAEPFIGTEIDLEGMIEAIQNTQVGPTNYEEIQKTDLVLPLHPHILECMRKANLLTDKTEPMLRFLGIKNEWFDAPDYTLQRALAEQGIKPKQETYLYVSPLTGRTAPENSSDAFKLYAQDTIGVARQVVERVNHLYLMQFFR